jgi:hypothetical protein
LSSRHPLIASKPTGSSVSALGFSGTGTGQTAQTGHGAGCGQTGVLLAAADLAGSGGDVGVAGGWFAHPAMNSASTMASKGVARDAFMLPAAECFIDLLNGCFRRL